MSKLDICLVGLACSRILIFAGGVYANEQQTQEATTRWVVVSNELIDYDKVRPT